METVAPAAAGQDATGELVDDVDVVVLHHVVHVALVEAVGAQELVHHVDARGALHEVGLRGALALGALVRRHVLVAVDLAHLARQVGDDEHLRVLRVHLVAALVG